MIRKCIAAVGISFAAVIAIAPVASAKPNQHAIDNANDNAQQRGLTVANATPGGVGAILSAIQAFAPSSAQAGLARAQCVAAGNCSTS